MLGARNHIHILMVSLLCIRFASHTVLYGTQLVLNDISPRFLRFYDSANMIHATEAQRWQLWKAMYDFAATPPTAAGDSIARKLLDSAWTRYPSIIPSINTQTSQQIFIEANALTNKISSLLNPDNIFEITLRLYVGGFETNAFTTANSGKILTSVPIELPSLTRKGLMAHELVHAIHIGMGSFSGGWKRTIATIVVTEGLAMQVSKVIMPGKPDSSYTEYSPGWLSAATKNNNELLSDVLEVLNSDSNADIMSFTMGIGPSGFEREAYYAGWVVVGYWLKNGWTFSKIAHIREGDMPYAVDSTIRKILQKRAFQQN